MKKTILFTIMMLMAVMVSAKSIQTVVLSVAAMPNYEQKMQNDLRLVHGITNIKPNPAANQVSIQYDADVVKVEKIVDSLRKAGYNVTVVNAGAGAALAPFTPMAAPDAQQKTEVNIRKTKKEKVMKNPGAPTMTPGVQMPNGMNNMVAPGAPTMPVGMDKAPETPKTPAMPGAPATKTKKVKAGSPNMNDVKANTNGVVPFGATAK